MAKAHLSGLVPPQGQMQGTFSIHGNNLQDAAEVIFTVYGSGDTVVKNFNTPTSMRVNEVEVPELEPGTYQISVKDNSGMTSDNHLPFIVTTGF
jgi:hypothetical protein